MELEGEDIDLLVVELPLGVAHLDEARRSAPRMIWSDCPDTCERELGQLLNLVADQCINPPFPGPSRP